MCFRAFADRLPRKSTGGLRNPLNSISKEELADLYGEDGTLTTWSQLGVPESALGTNVVIRINRQSGSGTYSYFREAVLGKKSDYKAGSMDMNGSKEVVNLVGSTPWAIGYSGMGYATPSVKMLKVAAAGQQAYAPTAENTLNKRYPLARSLLTYTLGEPQGAIKKYMDWQRSEAGQKIVEKTGFVPLASATVEP